MGVGEDLEGLGVCWVGGEAHSGWGQESRGNRIRVSRTRLLLHVSNL